MADQALSKGEILNIRWSHEDPNPTAQRFEEHDMTRRAAEGIKEKSKELGVPDYMIDGHQEIETKQHPYARIMEKDRQIIEGGKSAATDLSAQQLSLHITWQHSNQSLPAMSERSRFGDEAFRIHDKAGLLSM